MVPQRAAAPAAPAAPAQVRGRPPRRGPELLVSRPGRAAAPARRQSRLLRRDRQWRRRRDVAASPPPGRLLPLDRRLRQGRGARRRDRRHRGRARSCRRGKPGPDRRGDRKALHPPRLTGSAPPLCDLGISARDSGGVQESTGINPEGRATTASRVQAGAKERPYMIRTMTTFGATASLVLLAGCVAQREPIVDLKGIDPEVFQTDLEECRVYARQVSVAESVVVGAAVGALAGAIGGDAGEGAGYGGIYGGTVSGLDADREQRAVFARCLEGRGYRVLNYSASAAGSMPRPVGGAVFTGL